MKILHVTDSALLLLCANPAFERLCGSFATMPLCCIVLPE